MKRVVDVLYGLKGYPNAARFTTFKTDLFANGSTPTMTIDTAGTNGVTISAAMTAAGILLSSTYLNGINFNGVAANTSTGIKFKAGYLGHTITTGDYASATDKGVTLTSTNDYNAAFLADDSDASIGASVRNLLARTYLGLTQAGGSIRSVMGQLKLETGTNLGTGVYCAAQAYLEFAGNHSITAAGKVSGLDVSLEIGASKTVTVDSSAYLAGVKIELSAPEGTATLTQTGDCAAVYVDKAGTITDWKVGVDLNNCTTGIDIGACTTGVTITGTCTTAFNLTGNATSAFQITSGTITNAINIAAAANITNFIKFNAVAGCVLAVDVNPKDTPSGGGLGADGCIRIDIGGLDYFIPIFAVELS